MSVTVGNKTGSAVANNTTLTWAHTVAAGTNRMLVVQVGFLTALTGITYNGVAMTLLGTYPSAIQAKVGIYYLLAPTVGAHNVVVTSSVNDYMEGAAVDFQNVLQTPPSTTYSQVSPTTADISMSIGADDYFFAFMKYWDDVGACTANGGQTLVYSGTADTIHRGISHIKAGPGSVDIGYTVVRHTGAVITGVRLSSYYGYSAEVTYAGSLTKPQPEYPSSLVIECKIGGSWINLSADVIGDITVDYGITGYGIVDRVADVGFMEFYLRNDAGNLGGYRNYYTPGSTNAKAGFLRGIPVRLKITYQGTTYVKFYGHINNISMDLANQKAKIVVYDWMDYAVNANIDAGMTIRVGYTSDEVADDIVGHVYPAPLHRDEEAGSITFPFAFADVVDKTYAMTEFQKCAVSGIGYIYIKRDAADGETFVFEDRLTRNSTNVPKTWAGTVVRNLKREGSTSFGMGLLTEAGEQIDVDYIYHSAIFPTVFDAEVLYGDYMVNRITVKSYPQTHDTSYVQVWALTHFIYLTPGAAYTFDAIFEAPAGSPSTAYFGATNVIAATPGAYLFMNAQSDGLGADKSAYLGVSQWTYGNRVRLRLINNDSVAAYVVPSCVIGGTTYYTRLLGKGVYGFSPHEYIVEDVTSEQAYGYYDETLDLTFIDFPSPQTSDAYLLLQLYKNPQSLTRKISMIANEDEFMMGAYLKLDIGDLITVLDNLGNMPEASYYIQRVSAKIRQGNFITYDFHLVPFFTLT